MFYNTLRHSGTYSLVASRLRQTRRLTEILGSLLHRIYGGAGEGKSQGLFFLSLKKTIKYTSISFLLLFVLFFFLEGEGGCRDDYCLEEEPYYSKGP